MTGSAIGVIKVRKAGPDIIRAFAIFFVMLTHMFSYSGTLGLDLRSPAWCARMALHYIGLICVPLFLLLTGYLQSERRFDKRHYLSLLPVVISYLVIITVTEVLKVRAQGMPEGGVGRIIINILGCNDGYSWYVGMYLGLALLIPFINAGFAATGRKEQRIIIGSLVLLTMLPTTAKSFIVTGIWFDFLPDFFEFLYPLTYYLIGAYIHKYKCSPPYALCAAVFALTLCFETTAGWAFARNEYPWWLFNDNGELPLAVAAVSFFLMLYRVGGSRLSKAAGRICREISVCAFEMYLISYITDGYFYTHLPYAKWQILFINFAVCFAAARLLRLLLEPVYKAIKRL